MPVARSLVRWGLRLAGLGLVALVLVTQVRWHDSLHLADGSVREGRVRPVAGGWQVQPREAGAAVEVIASSRVAGQPGQGSEADLRLGLASLLERLGTRLPLVALVLAGLLALIVLTAWRWQLLVRALGLLLGFATALRLTFVGLFFNVAVPGATGGDIVKAWHAARRLGSGTRAVVSVIFDRFVGLFGLVLLAGLALVLVVPQPGAGGHDPYAALRTLVVVALASGSVLAAVLLSARVRRWLGLALLGRLLPLASLREEAGRALASYRSRPGLVLLALGLSLANHAGLVVAAMLLADALGGGAAGLGFTPFLIVVPLASLAGALPLLPGGWGVGELAYAWLLAPFGVASTEAVMLSVLLRLAQVAVSLPGGLLWAAQRGAHRPGSMAEDLARAGGPAGSTGVPGKEASA